MSTTSVRAVVITLNNPTGPLEWPEYVRYGVYQREKGEQGTEHFQGYAEFHKTQRFSALKKWLPTAHFEPRKGTRDQARNYCMKEDTRVDGPWEYGTWATQQGKRTDLDNACDTLKDEGVRGVALKHPREFVKYHAGFKALERHLRPRVNEGKFKLSDFPVSYVPITDWSKVHVFWGVPGAGKTQFALAHFTSPLVVRHIDTLKCFVPGVHDGLVFDDMNFTHWPRESQIHLLDMEVDSDINVKHETSYIPAGTKRIFCTNVDDGAIFFLGDGAIDRRIVVTSFLAPLGSMEVCHEEKEFKGDAMDTM